MIILKIIFFVSILLASEASEVKSKNIVMQRVFEVILYLDEYSELQSTKTDDLNLIQTLKEFQEFLEGKLNVKDKTNLNDVLSKFKSQFQKSKTEDQINLIRQLRSDLIEALRLTVTPASSPDLEKGEFHYKKHCTHCHGATGRGDGVLAKQNKLSLPAFDQYRYLSELRIFYLLKVGSKKKLKPSFIGLLKDTELWNLAFYTQSLAQPSKVEKPKSPN